MRKVQNITHKYHHCRETSLGGTLEKVYVMLEITPGHSSEQVCLVSEERQASDYLSSPLSAMTTLALGVPLFVPCFSTALTTLMPSTTLPNTTCFPFSLDKKRKFILFIVTYLPFFKSFQKCFKKRPLWPNMQTCIFIESAGHPYLVKFEVTMKQYYYQEAKSKSLLALAFQMNCPMLLRSCFG